MDELKYKFLWVSIGEWRGYWFTALGAHTIAGYLDNNLPGEVVQNIWYYDCSDIKNFFNHLAVTRPTHVGISVNIGYVKIALDLSVKIKKTLHTDKNNCQLIFGNREFFDLNNVSSIFKLIPDALIVTGDGEDSVLKILQGKNFKEIPNLYYMENKNTLRYTYTRNLAKNDYIAPLFDIKIINKEDLELNKKVAYVEVSRGCFKKPPCSFCSNSIKGNRHHWRLLKFEETIKCIIEISKNKPMAINFVAEDFIGEGGYFFNKFIESLENLRSNGIISCKTTFYAAIKVEDVYLQEDSEEEKNRKETLLLQMRRLGFTTLFLGFESGSNSQLQRYFKKTSSSDNENAISLLRKLQINIDGGFIPFDNMVSLDECLENIRFLKNTNVPKLHLFPLNRLYVQPGTIYENKILKTDKLMKRETVKLLAIVQKIDRSLPYLLLENYLQVMRIYYFTNNHDKIKKFEKHAMFYGRMVTGILEKIVYVLRNDDDDVVLENILNNFYRKHNKYVKKLRKWFIIEEPWIELDRNPTQLPFTSQKYLKNYESHRNHVESRYGTPI